MRRNKSIDHPRQIDREGLFEIANLECFAMDGQIDTGIEHRERQTGPSLSMRPTIPAIAWLSVTSPGAATIRPLSFSASPASSASASSLRAVAYTVNPSAARLSASALPMPLDAPVTQADPSAGLAVKVLICLSNQKGRPEQLRSRRPVGSIISRLAQRQPMISPINWRNDPVSFSGASMTAKPMHGRPMSAFGR
jgi:hypothetical protein